jgi:sec-independent protein translocase protein TatB
MPTSLGPLEILVIMVVALIVLGPERLPKAARQIGKAVAEVRHWSSGIQDEVKSAFNTDAFNTDAEPSPPPAAPPTPAARRGPQYPDPLKIMPADSLPAVAGAPGDAPAADPAPAGPPAPAPDVPDGPSPN